jgi:hypothetical protein
MSTPLADDITPSRCAGDGVRVVVKRPVVGEWRRPAILLALLAVAGSVGFLAWHQAPAPRPQVLASESVVAPTAVVASGTPPTIAPRTAAPLARRTAPAPAFEDSAEAYEMPSLDPDDIAAYIRPGDPEPTMAEVIDALNHVGIHDGLGAFSPPGTSPPLQGLAVPEDFALPEGYVRHHQVTDGGEPIEPILMFSPDYQFVDATGRPITLPENRVVQPELAPPGLPIRPVEIPSP